jgi:hypothetical protein
VLQGHEIVEKLIAHLRGLYERPLMFGGTAEGVELLLDSLHWTWAMCHEREADYERALADLHYEAGHQAMNCFGYYAHKYPHPTEEAKVAHVVSCFRRLEGTLGLDVSGKDGLARKPRTETPLTEGPVRERGQ